MGLLQAPVSGRVVICACPSPLSSSLPAPWVQILANVFLYLCAIIVGVLSYYMADRKHRKAFLEARQSLEVRMNLEEQSQQQVSPPGDSLAPAVSGLGAAAGAGARATALGSPWGLLSAGQVPNLAPWAEAVCAHPAAAHC